MTDQDIIDTLYNKLQQELNSTLFPEGTIMDETLVETIPGRSTKVLMAFFSENSRPCGPTEFMAFWKSLTDDQKEYYRTCDLTPTKA